MSKLVRLVHIVLHVYVRAKQILLARTQVNSAVLSDSSVFTNVIPVAPFKSANDCCKISFLRQFSPFLNASNRFAVNFRCLDADFVRSVQVSVCKSKQLRYLPLMHVHSMPKIISFVCVRAVTPHKQCCAA